MKSTTFLSSALLALSLVSSAPAMARPTATPKNTVASPAGWSLAGSTPEAYTVGVDAKVKHDGKAAAFLRSSTDPGDGFGTLMQTVAAKKFQGKRVRFSAWVKTDKLASWAGLWMRVDGPRGEVFAFDNMQERSIKATTDWKHYEVVLDVDATAASISFGTLLVRTGDLWIDSVELVAVPNTVPTTVPAPDTLPEAPTNLGFEG